MRAAGALKLHAHGEVVDATLFALGEREVGSDDFDQLGLGHPLAVARQIAQQFRHALVGLRDTGQQHALAFLLDALQVEAIRQLKNRFIQQVHRQVAVRLEVFDGLLPGPQRRDLFLKRRHFLDFVVELLDLGAQKSVAILLTGNFILVPQIHAAADQCARHRGCAERRIEHLARTLARHLPMREQVDQDHRRNLRIARPHAVR